jgi:tetratricopeptide (TPR) repeat protein
MRAVYDAMDNENRTQRKLECVAALFAGAARKRPLLLVVEDLHWADGQTVEQLARLARLAGEQPVILLMSSRIEGDPLDSAWRYSAGASPFTTIDLMPLRPEEAMQIAEEFVDINRIFAKECVARAEGNPLFLDQLLRSAIGHDQEAVPGSVQSIVLARVDLLSPEDKRALQAAAVLGQLFSLEVLRHLLAAPAYDCAALVKNHLVRAAGDDFLFAHALIWESVYASLLHSHREELHVSAADWFAARDPGLYAEHLSRAGDDRAPAAYLEAARAKSRRFHFESALELVESGLALARAAADSYRLLMLKGECTREMGQAGESTAIYRAALEAAEGAPARCRALIGLAAGMRVTDDFDAAFAALDEAQTIAEAEELHLERSQIHYYRGNLFFPLGEIEGCLKQHEQALTYAERAQSTEDEARALSGLGDAYYSRGRMITALDYFRRCIDLCRQQGYGRIAVGNQYMVAWGRFYLNEVAGALEDALAAIESAQRVGHQRAEMVARLTAGRVLVESGDAAAAHPHVERGLEFAESLGASRFKPFLLIYVARIRFARGAPADESVKLMREALDLARQTGAGFLAPWVLSTLALVSDEPAAALEALGEGEELLAEGCVGHNYYAFYRNAIEVALRLEDWRQAERYAEALSAYAAEEPLPWSEFVSARGRALAARGRGERGEANGHELERLRKEAEQAGLHAPLVAIQQALAAA